MNLQVIQRPVVAGTFYPADGDALRQSIGQCMDGRKQLPRRPHAKALIAPHAGYIYSGPVAASAYHLLTDRSEIRQVVLLGPSHRVAFSGLAISNAERFRTPLGDIPVNRANYRRIETLPQIIAADQAFALEHSLEVHLPFLQEVLGDFELTPLVVGDASPEQVAQVLERLWGEAETLVVISTDLSHFLDYQTACATDRRTSDYILGYQTRHITADRACGRNPLNGLLELAASRQLSIDLLDLRNSGDTAGGRDRVVGYGAYALH